MMPVLLHHQGGEHYTGRYPIIHGLLSVCFDDAMHGRYASFYVNKEVKSKLLV